MTKTKHL